MSDEEQKETEENELEVVLVIQESRARQYFKVFIAAIMGSGFIPIFYAMGVTGIFALLSGATATVFCIYVADQTGDLIHNYLIKRLRHDSGDNGSSGSDSDEVS